MSEFHALCILGICVSERGGLCTETFDFNNKIMERKTGLENPGRHETRGQTGPREGEPGKKYFLRLS